MPQKKNRTDAVLSALLPDCRVPTGYTVLKYTLLLAVFIYILSYLLIPFANEDPAYYTVLGRGMLRYHLLPYAYAFDHKPLGVDLFYGLWDQITPFYRGKFTLLAFVLSGVIVCVCRAFGAFSRWTAFILLIVGGAIFDILSGNSELVLLTGEALCLTLMLKGLEKNQNSLFFLAGCVAAFVVNVNYLAALCLLAPASVLLFSPGWFRLSRCGLTLLGGITGLVVLFSPYVMAGHGALQSYFSMQQNFLHHYSGSWHERLRCLFWNTVDAVLLSPILLAWCRRFSPMDWTIENRKNLLLPLWFLSSLPATILSGHPFDHYFLLCFVPAAIMWAILLRQNVTLTGYTLIPFFVFVAFFMVQNTHKNINTLRFSNRVNYAALHKEIGLKKVLNIRTHESVFYMSDLNPFDPYLFYTHIDIMYGQQAWQHYLQDLEQNAPYVVMPYDACTRHQVEAPVCQWIQAHYQLIYAVNVRPSRPNKFSLSIYKLIQPAQGQTRSDMQTH
ncbi:hypothetical protein [Acetobacter sp. LMG 32666]|uniref:hypothetical protein n=1 Tax=Acetobacter sp. LMG 32666 TaxID=2959295 RepID=UPI0030C7D0A5